MGGGGSKQEAPPRPKPPLDTPWRETAKRGRPLEWNEASERELRAGCLNTELRLQRRQRVQILMLGATGSGKSSFLNSLYGAIKDEINQWTHAAASATTVTKTLYNPRLKVDGRTPWFKIMDAPGIMEEDEAFYKDFVTMTLDGHIKEGVQIPPGGIQQNLEYYEPSPGRLDSPCLVVFVVKAGGYVPDSVLKRKFDIVKERAGLHRVKIAVVLTKADILSQEEERPLKGANMKYLHHSEAARDAVRLASAETGIPENQIFPVTNYTDQVETCTEMNVAILYTFSKLLKFAALEAENRIDSDDEEDD